MLAAFTKLYADQHAAHGIRMNNVLSGFIDSLPGKDCGRAEQLHDWPEHPHRRRHHALGVGSAARRAGVVTGAGAAIHNSSAAASRGTFLASGPQ